VGARVRATLTPQGAVAIPDSGGRVLVRASADAVTSSSQDFVFYGATNYAANPTAYNSAVKINTPDHLPMPRETCISGTRFPGRLP